MKKHSPNHASTPSNTSKTAIPSPRIEGAQAKESPAEREKRILQLKTAIANQSYVIPYNALATLMLADLKNTPLQNSQRKKGASSDRRSRCSKTAKPSNTNTPTPSSTSSHLTLSV